MRNEESHFSVNPTNLDIGRSRFPRPFNHKTTFNVGDLIPFYWSEILPGDTVEMKTSKVVRMSTLIDPVMDNIYLDCYYFFVPMRLVWDHTKEFFGENTSGPWAPSITYTIPQMKSSSSSSALDYVHVGDVADYMGVPTGIRGLSVNALPIRAYNKVYGDWFMDQMTMSPPNLYTGDSDVTFSDLDPVRGGKPYKAAKLHDYFSSSTPAPQRGPTVTLPIGGSVPVTVSGSTTPVMVSSSSHNMGGSVMFNGYTLRRAGLLEGKAELSVTNSSYSGSDSPINNSNLVASWPSDAEVNLSGALPVSINDLRMAFQLQKWYEKSAMYGKVS